MNCSTSYNITAIYEIELVASLKVNENGLLFYSTTCLSYYNYVFTSCLHHCFLLTRHSKTAEKPK